MRALLTVLVAFTLACTAAEPLPPGPNGGVPVGGVGTPGQPGGDGGGNGGDGLLTGTLCRIVDLRNPRACGQLVDMGDIPVRVQGSAEQALTAPNGSFILDIGNLDTFVLEAGFGLLDFQPTLLPLRAQDGLEGVVVPVVDTGYFNNLLDALLVPLAQETGTVAVYPLLEGQPLDSVLIDSASFSGGIFYDNGGALDWIEASTTASDGAALIFGVLPPTTEFVASDLISNDTVAVDLVPVGPDSITFLTLPFD